MKNRITETDFIGGQGSLTEKEELFDLITSIPVGLSFINGTVGFLSLS